MNLDSKIPFLPGSTIKQLAFVVPDSRAAAAQHAAIFGSGPFLAVPHYALDEHRYRGVETNLDVTSVYGQWGEVQVEFVELHNDDKNAYSDLHPRNSRGGMHHVAVFCDDRAAAVAEFERAGFQEALYAARTAGRGYSIIDTVAVLGYMVEVYEEAIVGGFYDYVRRLSDGYDGSDPVREFDFASLG